MVITMISDEICALLEVDKNKLKKLNSRNKLEENLRIKGYTLVNKYKQGRDNIYELKLIEKDEWSEYQQTKNIKKKKEHTIYVENRITIGLKEPRRNFVKMLKEEMEIDLSETTAGRYDKMLIEDDIMEKDGEVYLFYNPKEGVFSEVTKEEYSQFWKNASECRYYLRHNYLRYKKGEISEKTYDNNKYIFINELGNKEGVVAIKYPTYKEYLNTKQTLEMIRKHKKLKEESK